MTDTLKLSGNKRIIDITKSERNKMIDRLIEDEFDTIMNSDYGTELVRDYLANGFPGFHSLNNAALIEEMTIRGLEIDND